MLEEKNKELKKCYRNLLKLFKLKTPKKNEKNIGNVAYINNLL